MKKTEVRKEKNVSGLTVLKLPLETQTFYFHFFVSHHSCYSNKMII